MASMFERIAVPIDESDPSRAASQLALEIAGSDGGHLAFCHALDTRDLYDSAATYGYDPRPLVVQMRAEAEDWLDGATDDAHTRGIDAQYATVEGLPVDAILAAAAAQSEFDYHRHARTARARAPLRRQHDRRGLARDRNPAARRACRP